MKNEKNISLNINYDQDISPKDLASERIIEVSLLAPEVERVTSRQPLNIALVLDRSGSMSGEKIKFVKQAAAHIVNSIYDTDRIALVQYDNNIDILFPSAPLDASSRAQLLASIRSIRSGAATNLYRGWLTGCNEVAKTLQDQSVNRTLLLTDGLANEEITDLEHLALLAQQLASRGVSTSTFGVGSDFNQHLLEAMANQGGGRFYFIEAPQDIPNIFAAELKELTSLFAKDIELTLSYPLQVGITILGEWRSENTEPGKLKVFLGSLVSGRSLEIYAKVAIPQGISAEELSFTGNIFAKGEKGHLLESAVSSVIHLGTAEQAEAAPKNIELLSRYHRVYLAHTAAEALKLEKVGERKRASEMLQQTLLSSQPFIDEDINTDYTRMSERISVGMDELDRKRSHADAYFQKQRRLEYMEFHLENNVSGRLAFDVEGHSVLLYTGSPVSIGNRDHWRLLGRSIMLHLEYNGLTTDIISKILGVRIDVILGMDALQNLNIMIDRYKQEIFLSREPIKPGKINLKLSMQKDIPITEMKLAENSSKLILDTLLNLTFLSSKVLSKYPIVDKINDFYPGVGNFETNVHQVPLLIDRKNIFLNCGVLPQSLEIALQQSGINGILGTGIFDYYRAILAFPKLAFSLV